MLGEGQSALAVGHRSLQTTCGLSRISQVRALLLFMWSVHASFGSYQRTKQLMTRRQSRAPGCTIVRGSGQNRFYEIPAGEQEPGAEQMMLADAAARMAYIRLILPGKREHFFEIGCNTMCNDHFLDRTYDRHVREAEQLATYLTGQ